jgi:catechol O-methyltransferase
LLTDGFRTLRARMRGETDRREGALAYVRRHAAPGDADAVLRALDEYGRNHRFLMNVGDEKGPLLEGAVRDAGPTAQILELGCYMGYSAILMARLLGEGGKLTSIEKSATSARIAGEIISHAGVADRVRVVCGSSGDEIEKLEGTFDIVFLDHWKGLYTEDLQRIETRRLLKPGSVVIADNVGPFFGAEKYLSYVRGCGRYDNRNVKAHVEYQTVEDAVEISVMRAEAGD